jgi:hypothetical protein
MYQTDRGTYQKKETASQAFTHSCLGKLIILAAIAAVLLLIAHLTVPDEQAMRKEMDDNIRQCIEANDSIQGDWLDDAINNVGYIFTTADGTIDQELMDNFKKYNRLEYYKHTFHSSMRIYNNFRTEGERVGIGIFGIVIPTVNFNDFLLRVGPMHKDYGERIIKNIYYEDSYLGDNPMLKPYHYKGNPED